MSKNIQRLVMIDLTMPLTFLFFLAYKMQETIRIMSYVKMVIVLLALFALCLDVVLKHQPEKKFTLKLSARQKKLLTVIDVINMGLLILLVETSKSTELSIAFSILGIVISGFQCFMRGKSLEELGD